MRAQGVLNLVMHKVYTHVNKHSEKIVVEWGQHRFTQLASSTSTSKNTGLQ